ncbi:MAG: nonribosomal peptide synthetase MxaA, partial [Gemmatimonadetes bacterium]|nr:amino acid adenylation domain-containing protein [Gemmatimonadota bacterium]NIX46220.1 nonribosomal peptide synthetase MxaA [Gemmatimonadota bacterium]NIY10552.1 nonribosomal peptide synthetase MxaA [Gemmatimonadota bacterium]
PEGASGPRLVGFVVGTEESAQDLRSFLHRELPAAMVPATIVFLESLPRSPSGKVDRRLLS